MTIRRPVSIVAVTGSAKNRKPTTAYETTPIYAKGFNTLAPAMSNALISNKCPPVLVRHRVAIHIHSLLLRGLYASGTTRLMPVAPTMPVLRPEGQRFADHQQHSGLGGAGYRRRKDRICRRRD